MNSLMRNQLYDYNRETDMISKSSCASLLQHELSSGTAREKILKVEIESRLLNTNIFEGFVSSDEDEYISTQVDVLIAKNNAHIRPVPPHVLIEPNDVMVMIEVKTNLTKGDLTKLNDLVLRIKSLYNVGKISVGIFSYGAKMSVDTILGYYAIKKDWEYGNVTKEGSIEFPFIDFLCTLDTNQSGTERKPLLIYKDENDQYQWYFTSPVIGNFINLIRSCSIE